ncbi:type A chloramphenicol O-acetyltransferase [Cytobacillus massiliigabonensis]|uniref:type A chloramphenicol O-acetyltransferase n=1 Tax=Cytobacillus massiliigabonensis TaxID=1871011 RepID=UPI000C8230BC|nr:type A chloramphenicol O-acetyltransferase [Cytobacillus massiliigabonensis]
MEFNKIDINNWERKEIFNHFLNQQTSFSITRNIDITELYKVTKEKGYKFYPVFIFLVTHVVNSHKNFRMNFNSDGEFGYWDKLIPLYTIFDKTSELFSAISTNTDEDFKKFYDNYVSDAERYNGTGKMFPKTPIPENVVNISMIPWTPFTGFNLNLNNNPNYFLPIVTAGGFIYQNSDINLPLSLQVHHSVCDGYHAALFMDKIQTLADNPQGWLE